MRIQDALRMINKCKALYPKLDFTTITLHTKDNYQYRFGAESAGVCNGQGDIHIRIPRDGIAYFTYPNFMRTIVHEAIHRYVLFHHGKEHHGHGKMFQEACLEFGLDPIKESFHDKKNTVKIYPMNKADYLKYRMDDGDRYDPRANTDAEWAFYYKHDKTYDRSCPAYKRHQEATEALINKVNEKRERLSMLEKEAA